MSSCRTCHRQFIDTQTVCPLDDTRLDLTPSKEPLPQRLGQVLGSYRLIGLLGEGGMGSIYVGAHTRLNRYVAIKLLRRELSHRKDHIARFFDEARTVNRIKHPNIVEVIDLVEDVVGGAYCVLELLHGPDLKSRLARGALPVDSAIQVGAQIADALSAVHEIGIVHRDLKPDNVILISRAGRDDFVKLIDFGVAQISEEEATGIPFGTAAYMSPEQAAGERVDGRADVYALGVLLFEMVTGRHPFPSQSDNQYLLRHADDAPPRPSKLVPGGVLPRGLDAVILRCLAKAPGDRYATAAAVAVALRAIDPHRKPRSAALAWSVALVLLAGGAAAAYFVPPYLDAQKAESSAHAAAAPPPAPAPVPVPAEGGAPAPDPKFVTISFVSVPDGAEVFRAGETVPLGVTPFAAPLPRSDRPGSMRFELDGYRTVEVAVTMTQSDQISVTLEPAAEPAAKPAKRPGPGPAAAPRPGPSTDPDPTKKKPVQQREGVMDPFAS